MEQVKKSVDTAPSYLDKRAVIFDVGGVIVSETIQIDPIAEIMHANTLDARNAIYEGIWTYRNAYDRGLPDREYWEQVAHYAKLPPPTSEQIDSLVELDARRWRTPDPTVKEFIKNLTNRGMSCAILSNAPFSLAQQMLNQRWVQSYILKASFSCFSGLAKPDLEAFANVVRELHIEPNEAIFFDDRQINVEAARRLGLDGRIWQKEMSISQVYEDFEFTFSQ